MSALTQSFITDCRANDSKDKEELYRMVVLCIFGGKSDFRGYSIQFISFRKFEKLTGKYYYSYVNESENLLNMFRFL